MGRLGPFDSSAVDDDTGHGKKSGRWRGVAELRPGTRWTLGRQISRQRAHGPCAHREGTREFRTNCTVHLWQGMSLEAHGIAAEAYQSADLACERLEKRVRLQAQAEAPRQQRDLA